MYEYPDFMIDWKYAKISQIYLTTMFYSSILPSGLYMAIIALLLSYWSAKYDFIAQSSIPYSISSNL